MEMNYKITIPTPCHEDWNQMTATTTGRFCGSCTKNVVDFTAMMPVEIQQYFTANKGQSICGRFKNEQLETIIIQVPSSVLYSQVSFHKAFLLALFVAMGTTIFSCKDVNGNAQKIDKVEVVDSITHHVFMGAAAPSGYVEDTIATPPPVEQVKFTKPTKGKAKCTTIETETTTGVIALETVRSPEIMGMPVPEPEVVVKPVVEDSPKP